MRRILFFLFIGISIGSNSFSQSEISLTGATYSQDFNTLASSGSAAVTGFPVGWLSLETGTGANTNYTAGTGSSNTGDTYSFGAASNSDRALGGLLSGSVSPSFGAVFLNSTGSTITTITLNFTAEQWRLGALARADRLDFQYSLDATSLSTGTWTNVDNLDATAPVTAGTVGALDGNASANKVAISYTITGLSIVNGAKFYIKWVDFNASGSDDGIGIDDLSLSYTTGVVNTASVVAGVDATESGTSGTFTVNLSAAAPAGGITVNYSLTGTAVTPADYSDALNGSITIAEGASFGTITIVPVDDIDVEGNETIICTPTSVSGGYSLNTTAATITLIDNDGNSLYSYAFTSCTAGLSDGFIGYSTTGAEAWACTTFGQSGNGIQMNGFAGTAQNNEDWVISPALNLSSTTIPLLTFYSRTKFSGPSLKLYVSTNYSGSGDPAAAAWTEINGKFPATHSDVWTLSSGINLSAFKQASVYIAFVYTSTTAGASRWTIDNINVIDAAVAPAPGVSAGTKLIDLRQINFGSSSTAKTVGFWADNLTSDLTITAPAGMELSKDGASFSNPLIYTAGETVNAQKTLHIKFTPQSANANYAGYLQFSSTSLSATPVFVKGHSYPSDQTLNIVNWNIEWFGSAASGPADEVLQQANAKATMEYINADAYALAEIVDATRFGNLVSSLAGGYSYVLGEFCSSGATPAACASAQKLAFVYKTSVFSNVTARPLMNNGTGSTAYTNWASGRYPYLVNATVNKNGVTKNINFIVLHAKAQGTGTEVTDYNRRKGGVDEMKDTLNTYFSNANVMILGDFNDDLDSTIVPEGLGINPRISSYTTLISDSTDSDSYRSVTLPLSLLSKNSTFSYADFIDHAVISNEMANAYINYSATIYDDISALAGIANFSTTTSDHYPVMNSFLLSALIPSKLISFTVSKKDNSALINWTTAQEINSKHFVVERSIDGRSFSSIGTVVAAGNSAFQRNYQFVDATPAQGLNYYRIKTIDIDSRADLSKVASIHFGKSFYFGFGPNPAKEILLITIENVSGAGVVQLSDLQGRSLMQSRVEGTASQTIRMNVSGLSKGVYLLQLKAGAEVKTAKVVIE